VQSLVGEDHHVDRGAVLELMAHRLRTLALRGARQGPHAQARHRLEGRQHRLVGQGEAARDQDGQVIRAVRYVCHGITAGSQNLSGSVP